MRTIHPLLLMLLWLGAAFIVIGLGPMWLFPSTNSFVRIEAVLWKMFGASLFLAASLYLLRKREWGRDPLGLMPDGRGMLGLVAGISGGAALVALSVMIFRAQTAFHFQQGSMLASEFLISALVYFFGALLEELAFRGYPLLRLKRHYGPLRAVLIVALAFGILHLPGLSGAGAIKMIVTTGLCSILFSIAYLRSGTLWAAVGLHMGMNVALHSVFGSSGQSPSLLQPVYSDTATLPYDPGFASFVLVALVAIAVMTFFRPRRAPPTDPISARKS